MLLTNIINMKNEVSIFRILFFKFEYLRLDSKMENKMNEPVDELKACRETLSLNLSDYLTKYKINNEIKLESNVDTTENIQELYSTLYRLEYAARICEKSNTLKDIFQTDLPNFVSVRSDIIKTYDMICDRQKSVHTKYNNYDCIIKEAKKKIASVKFRRTLCNILKRYLDGYDDYSHKRCYPQDNMVEHGYRP